MRQAFADIQAQGNAYPVTGSPLAIWYVPSDGNAGSLAEVVHGCLAADGFQVDAVAAVPRQTAAMPGRSRPVSAMRAGQWVS